MGRRGHPRGASRPRRGEVPSAARPVTDERRVRQDLEQRHSDNQHMRGWKLSISALWENQK